MTVPDSHIVLEFDGGHLTVADDVDIRTGLSAIVRAGDDLWLACDEGCRLERLSRSGSSERFASHAVFPLDDLLALPGEPTDEADIEGLDVDDGWLWLVGSHSVKRSKAGGGDRPSGVAAKLARTARDGHRHVLARIPLDGNVPVRKTGARRAGAIAAKRKSSALLKAIVEAEDEHLAPFVEIPGKDNGFDIEGLAVRGGRAFIGLRGPVLREWCCILELQLKEGKKGTLRLARVGGGGLYRKHFLKLGGLGVRDLAWLGDDLLILAGPTMALDGAVEIWRWKNAAKSAADTRPNVERVLVVPNGQGNDRAEGMTVFERGRRSSVLVVFDSPADNRLVGGSSVRADVYVL